VGQPHFVPQGYDGGTGMNPQQYGQQQHAPPQMHHNAGFVFCLVYGNDKF
jgi:hypothetical protein